jgi:geranylgeranyl diphosphate synthase, type II
MNGSEIRTRIEAYLQTLPYNGLKPEKLYAPMHYTLGHEAKRVRPVMAALAYQYISGAVPEGILKTASAIEMVHNFTLIHDDIMDNAPVRRNKPTVHEKWDTNVAILSGDALFALSYPMLIQGFPHLASELVTFFTQVIVEVCEGQMEDMELASNHLAGIPEYLEMIRKKTAALIGGSLALGAMAAGADTKVSQQLYTAGECMGIGFQIQDDLLDVFADQSKFGKQVGGDIIENKKTFLWLMALSKADKYRKEALLNWTQDSANPEEKVRAVTAIYNELNIPEITQTMIQEYYSKANELLDQLPQNEYKADLMNYLHSVFMREK